MVQQRRLARGPLYIIVMLLLVVGLYVFYTEFRPTVIFWASR